MSRSGGFPRVPLWLRWAFSVSIAAVILVAIVLFVSNNNTNSLATQNLKAVARADREGDIVVEQDQAPHVVKVSGEVAPVKAAERAVRSYIVAQVGQGVIGGPIQSSTCAALKPRGTSLPFRCQVIAAFVRYPFLAVVDPGAKRVVYCKRDPPPVPSQNIPVSRRCRI